jgi:hypothetical protein
MAAGVAASKTRTLVSTRITTVYRADTGDSDMTITIINKGTKREQQQNGPCPYLIDCPPEPRR